MEPSWERAEKMENDRKQMNCALCGFTSEGRFEGDICPQCGLTYWKCGKCGFLVTTAKPPDTCPQCNQKCEFLNVTC